MITHESSLKDFSSQLNYVLDKYTPHGITKDQFSNVVLGGLGGSGIGSAVAKNWFFDKFSCPIEAINDYHLPSYANENTLVVLNSYSGNTEETLSMYAEAKSRNCKIVALSSGGKLTELANQDGVKLYPIEGGFQPRMTIGYGLSYLLLILGETQGEDLREAIKDVADTFIEKQDYQMDSARTVFNFFKATCKNKFVILADRHMYPLAVRFSQQLNENAKLEAFVNVIPEMNHNVLESYTDRLPTNFVLLYTNQNPRVEARFDFITGHLEMDNNKVLPMLVPQYDIYTLYDVTYRLDWVSVMLANELDAPLMEVPMISDLKEFLANIEIVDEGEE